MPTYEITLLMPNGDWVWWREDCRDFQAACESGITSANHRRARLLRVELIPALGEDLR